MDFNITCKNGRVYLEHEGDCYSFSDNEMAEFFYMGLDIRNRMDDGMNFIDATDAYAIQRILPDAESVGRDENGKVRVYDAGENYADEIRLDCFPNIQEGQKIFLDGSDCDN